MSMTLTKAIEQSHAFARTAYDGALMLKANGELGSSFLTASASGGWFDNYRDQRRDQESLSAFRGWLYSAVHALAMEAAAQPVSMAQLSGRRKPSGRQSYSTNKMTVSARIKAAEQQLDIVIDDPVLESLEHPNEMQHRWQFVYAFVASLNLTGWGYVIYDTDKDGKLLMYAVPSTWVTPIHTKGAFAEFKVTDPRNPSSAESTRPLTRDNVAFAYLPDPSNPLAAVAPASTQIPAIRIDGYIQSSQQQHFQNGIFPSVIVTMGRNPHPEVPGGLRPRLTAPQRRQVHAAIAKAMGGVANFGAPAIVDGMIESITKFSNTESEMGWARSEDKVRTRILSAFGVHPYILGEPVNVGGYAQAAKIEERFCKRVNTFLDMLGQLTTGVVNNVSNRLSKGTDSKLLVWWEETKPHDPALRWQSVQYARTNGDISQNELRAELGFPPDEDGNQAEVTSQMASQIVLLLTQLSAGAIQADQAKALLVAMGLSNESAEAIAGKATVIALALPPIPSRSMSEQEAVQLAIGEIKQAIVELRRPVDLDVGTFAESLVA